MRYASNCKISMPIPVAAKPDVDFNGVMFSYTIGLMYPAQHATQPLIRTPHPSSPPGIGKK